MLTRRFSHENPHLPLWTSAKFYRQDSRAVTSHGVTLRVKVRPAGFPNIRISQLCQTLFLAHPLKVHSLASHQAPPTAQIQYAWRWKLLYPPLHCHSALGCPSYVHRIFIYWGISLNVCLFSHVGKGPEKNSGSSKLAFCTPRSGQQYLLKDSPACRGPPWTPRLP